MLIVPLVLLINILANDNTNKMPALIARSLLVVMSCSISLIYVCSGHDKRSEAPLKLCLLQKHLIRLADHTYI